MASLGSFEIGDAVIATAGRDEGKIFIVIDVIDDLYVLIADGKTRKITNAKKKKIKHLCLAKKSDYEFHTIYEQNKITNAFLKKHTHKISDEIAIVDEEKIIQ